MSSTSKRSSTYVQASTTMERDKAKGGDVSKTDMWSSMLDSVASGKRLPEKNILVLGGSSETQREFLEALASDTTAKKTQDHHKPPPLANSFALGYTFLDVLDADHDDILARLSVYFLSDPSTAFAPLLKPLLTPQTIPNTLVVVLLDWRTPWKWLRELRNWIRLLRTLLVSLDDGCKQIMEEVMISWRDRGRGGSNLEGTGVSSGETDVSLPLGPGEWNEALGLPLCIVCQNADHMELLEKERSWREEEFDFVLQSLRTVLLKHGASLIYTTPSTPNQLPILMHSSLGIHSLLKKQPLKHNVIERDKILVPPNWDSWGKIRVLREGFDVEGVNVGWSVDIEDQMREVNENDSTKDSRDSAELNGAMMIYEDTIRDPGLDAYQGPSASSNDHVFEDEHVDSQAFLATQLETLERLKQEAASAEEKKENGRTLPQSDLDRTRVLEDGSVSEHIGPVQFNMGGIQVDADDMLQRLKDRQRYQTPEPTTPTTNFSDGKGSHEALASFFESLMNRGGSATGTPKPSVS